MVKSLSMNPAEKEQQLVQFLGGFHGAIVAFSGGVDSSYLAFLSHRTLGPAARIVTALSPSVSRSQEEMVRQFVARYGVNHQFIRTDEMNDPDYAANPDNRCYFCKSELFERLRNLREEWALDAIFDGTNADDLGDYRPGRKAAAEKTIVSPLAEVGMTKSDIRVRSKEWGLETWDMPATPCLASRLPYGVEVTPEKLRQVEAAESFLRSLGFTEFRVRHHESLARLEIAPAEMPKVLDPTVFDQINRELKALGYQYVTLDLQGFRSGSLNELLKLE